MKSIRGVIGAPAQGSEFWGRERELSAIWQALETGSVLLTAPRRFGKTSLMLRLVEYPQDGWQAFYFDPEWIKRPEDFIAEIAATLLQQKRLPHLADKVKKFFGNLVEKVDGVELGEIGLRISLRKGLSADWQDKGRDLIELLKNLDTKTILIIDELPLLVEKIAKEQGEEPAQEFLSWLRSLRQIPDLHQKVRWVTGGSIGIEKVLQRIGSGTRQINDLERIHVREFDEDSARKFIAALLHGAGVGRVPVKVLDKFLAVVGIPIPYFLQILVRESLNIMERTGNRAITEEIIEQAYEEGVLASYNRTYFEHYYERLRDYYSPETASVAKALLTEVARRETVTKTDLWKKFQAELTGQGNEDDFSYLLSDLENDFYLICDRDRTTFRFATQVLRDWWLRYHAP